MSRRRDWRQNPLARSERKRPKTGSGERGHGVGMARAGGPGRGVAGMGTALRGQRDTTWGLGGKEDRLPVPSRKRSPPGSSDTHPPTQAWLSTTLLAPRRSGLGSPPRARVLLASHLRLGGDRSPGHRVKRDPTDWAGGPPLAGRGAQRRGGCHASRALGNLGLQATPSGGSGSSRSAPCQGRRVPAEPASPLPPPRPAPHRQLPVPTPAAHGHTSRCHSALAPPALLAPKWRPPSSPAPQPRFLHPKPEYQRN